MDYLSAIQFAAATNIGYVIPNVLESLYKFLGSIDSSYLAIFQDIRNKTIVKKDEINRIQIIETKDDHSTQIAIDKLTGELDSIIEGCDEQESIIKGMIKVYIGRSGYRSLFFFSALFAIFSLIMIPLCHHHCGIWGVKWFLYTLSVISIVYLIYLFLRVVVKNKDISCLVVLKHFFGLVLLSAACSFVNSCLPVLIEISQSTETALSWMSIVVPFLPGICCIMFFAFLVQYSVCAARRCARETKDRFKKINEVTSKLDDFNKLLNGDITLS